jgi:hypothetical protein
MRRNDEVKFAEELRQDLHALAEEMAKREWTCPRFECHRRKFLSKERFETHMKVHCAMDVEVIAARREVYMRKMKRLNEEEEVGWRGARSFIVALSLLVTCCLRPYIMCM